MSRVIHKRLLYVQPVESSKTTMTEWNAQGYESISALQQAMASEVLAVLDRTDALTKAASVLDLGCGGGHVTAQIAARVPKGKVLGVDASSDMISFAREHYGHAVNANLRFAVADIRQISFSSEFDTIVSFNALHWIPQQAEALQAIHRAMRQNGFAQLRLVPKDQRTSLEHVLEETRISAKWSGYYEAFTRPYLHLTAEEYSALAEQNGFRVDSCEVEDKSWNFGTRAAFIAFANVTFVEWTRKLPEEAKSRFIDDVLQRYASIAGDDHTFRFYQMNIRLSPATREEVPI
jgi:trans-aconitate 2-methyltransferase